MQYSVESRKVSASTVEEYERVITKKVIPFIGHLKLSDLTKKVIEDFYDDTMLIRHNSASEVHRINKVLNKAFNDALEDESCLFLKKNPCHKAKLPEEPQYEPALFTEEDLRFILQITQGTTIELPVLLAATLGLRRGEAIGSDINDWNFSNNTFYLHQQIAKANPYAKGERAKYGIVPYLKTRGKKSKKARFLSVPKRVMDKVQERIEIVNWNKAHEPMYIDLGLLYCQNNGDFVCPKNVYQTFNRILKRNEIALHRFHDLRGSCFTLLQKNNIPLQVISDIAGHEDSRITKEKYCKSNAVSSLGVRVIENTLLAELSP